MRSEIPFNKTPAMKLIPWMIAIMVYLITLVLSLAVVVNNNIHQSQTYLRNTLMVEIVPTESDQQLSLAQEIMRRKAILNDLQHFAGVISARFTQPESNSFAEFWLPEDEEQSSAVDLFPAVIELKFDPLRSGDLGAIIKNIHTAFPSVQVIEDHPMVKNKMFNGWIILAGCMTLATLIAAAAMVTIVFATYTGVSLHEWAIDLLQLMGATDNYIAQRFRDHALQLSLKGGGIGGILAAFTFASIMYSSMQYPAMLKEIPQRAIWATIAITPLFIALMTLISSRITVLFALNRKDE
jgi:cell division transport system permease protein